MASRLKKHLGVLKLLKKSKPSFRRSLLATADSDLVRCICECCHNVLRGNVKLSGKQKRLLCRHKKSLRSLSSRRIGLKRKRQLLRQRGGLLPALLAPILGIVASIIGGAVR